MIIFPKKCALDFRMVGCIWDLEFFVLIKLTGAGIIIDFNL